jgi:hypothetical protein
VTPGRRGRSLLFLLAALPLLACDDQVQAPTTSSSSTGSTRSTIAPDDPTLEPLLLTAADLPASFAPTEDVTDTVTTFCAGQDATAGLSADGRAIVGFTRTPEGASVIEVVFRFEDDGAAAFVEQADELLTSCSDVPDATGLAFTYEPLSEPVATTLAEAAASAGRFGTSVGSGDLTVEVAVVAHGEIGALVAVLGLDQPRGLLDELAEAAFTAAIDKLT